MISRNVVIAIFVLLLVVLGFLFFSVITGNVVTNSVVVEDEYFKISELGDLNEMGVKNGENESGPE